MRELTCKHMHHAEPADPIKALKLHFEHPTVNQSEGRCGARHSAQAARSTGHWKTFEAYAVNRPASNDAHLQPEGL